MRKITVVGLGYVGLSNAVLLSQFNEVVALDIDEKKIQLVNNRVSPIVDPEVEEYLKERTLNLFATNDKLIAYDNSEFVIIATPTNYNVEIDYFDVSTVDNIINDVSIHNPKAVIIIKSTVPFGYTSARKKMYPQLNIIFSPEFLREGKALYDNLYPSRLVVGDMTPEAKIYSDLMILGAIKKDVPTLFTHNDEAEAIKLFSNTYLAMRVAFFNELDTFAEFKSLSTKEIIEGVCLDPRIGGHYNNPSFGYGGYCLPKDTKQLLANFSAIPQNIISAIVKSNDTRKEHITDRILLKNPEIVGVYRLAMKSNSDNFRDSAIQDIMINLQKNNVKVIIYEPQINDQLFLGFEVVNNISAFLDKSNIIVANRYDKVLNSVKHKVYTRDIFSRD